MLAEGTVVDPDDLFHATMVFQHGADRTHFLRAHELAKRAAELGSTRPARWLAGAAYDRWLMTGGRPQKYGDPVPVRPRPLGPARGRPDDL